MTQATQTFVPGTCSSFEQQSYRVDVYEHTAAHWGALAHPSHSYWRVGVSNWPGDRIFRDAKLIVRGNEIKINEFVSKACAYVMQPSLLSQMSPQIWLS